MRLPWLLLPVLALLAEVVSAQTPVDVPILNQTFNNDTLACSPGNYCYVGGLTGWICGPGSGVLKASSSQYPAAPPEGLYVAYMGNSTVTGSILQTLGATVQTNATYVLRIVIGARFDVPLPGYEAALVAGNVTLATGNKATPARGTFVTEEITYSSGAAPAQLGKPLQIFLKSLGPGQVNISAVVLTATVE